MQTHPRAAPATSLRQAEKWLHTYHLDRFVSPRLDGREVRLQVDEESKARVELLDGCYVLETNLPVGEMDAAQLDTRYRSLSAVERDFRTEKTGFLEFRPIFLRKARRTCGHAVVTMLALKVVRELDRQLVPAQITVQDALDRLSAVRSA